MKEEVAKVEEKVEIKTEPKTEAETEIKPEIKPVVESIPFEITEVNMEKLKEKQIPIIIDFGAEWCAPCNMIHPILAKMHKELSGRVEVHYIDVDESPKAASDFPTPVIPTQFFFNSDGSSYVPSEELMKKYRFKMYEDSAGVHVLTSHEGYLAREDFDLILSEMGIK